MTQPILTPTLLAAPVSGGAGAPVPPVLVLGAGLGTAVGALWAEALPYLEGFQVVGIDLPGHGRSPAAAGPFSVAELAGAVAATVRALQQSGDLAPASPVYYAGVSLSGAVGLQLGLDAPELFAGIGVICSAAKLGNPEAWLQRAETVRVSGTPTMLTGSAQRWFAPGFMEAYPQRASGLLHSLQQADRFSYAWCCEALSAFDLRSELGRLAVPVLVIAGDRDQVCPPVQAEETAAGVQDGRCAVVVGVAHQAPLEAPQQTVALLRDFFTALGPERGPTSHERTVQ